MVLRASTLRYRWPSSGEEASTPGSGPTNTPASLLTAKSVDEVAGYLYAKDFLVDPAAPGPAGPHLSSVRREILFVPETQSLLDVSRSSTARAIPIAVVVDEYGGTSGILTMEGLLEEIVGEIRDGSMSRRRASWCRSGRTRGTSTPARRRAAPLGVVVEGDEWAENVGTVVLTRLGESRASAIA